MLKLGTKKPKQERSKSTVEAIIQAVTHIMDKDGPMGLTTNKIAEKAGVSVGSLYQYFKNKESIFESILLRMTEENLNNLEQHLAQRPDDMNIRKILQLIIQSHFENMQRMGKITSVLMQYAPQVLNLNHFKKSDERIINFLTEKTQEYNILIGPKNPKDAFFICSQTVRSVMAMTFITKAPEERQQVIDELIQMLSLYLETPSLEAPEPDLVTGLSKE